ncbi:MAG: [FeFe] hydrogenase H-cluster radical SAM maturase HydG [Bacteroidales bacterium]|jgi:2-iminoacetate synthase|nr:[FeFe] hydrogenase H-cluster radical SAM maturase HydG [Bacteroidales bacterium]
MIFTPEKYEIQDERQKPFISIKEIENALQDTKNPDKKDVLKIIDRSLNKKRLTLKETATLINADTPELIEAIKEGARKLKEMVYGNRIVLFAPLYIGNKCKNNCQYCGFRSSNKDAQRKTLSDEEIIKEIEALEDNGQKRLILVYGEHDSYNPEYIAHTVRLAYNVKKGNGEIRRVNINAAPLDIEGFRIVHNAGIGTYQVFQETYHKPTYEKYHLSGPKRDFEYRLTSLDRAQEAGLDDVGIGALFGLYDWRFEVMALIRHTNHLEACYNVGPHTISFPRIKSASGLNIDEKYLVTDEELVRIIAILRLAVPYTGLILTARESASIRDEVMKFGVSQIDGGTKLELGSYSETKNEVQDLNREQFEVNDTRSLSEIIYELIDKEYIPSFCTACYRLQRTGEHFMEFSVPGFIKKFCTPNAILTLAEYLMDYAKEDTASKGWKLIENELQKFDDKNIEKSTREKIEKIKQGERDLYF